VAVHTSPYLENKWLCYLCTVRIPRPFNWCHRAGSASNTGNAGGDVFGKQAGFVFAEFLSLLLIFPWLHACVGLTIDLIGVLSLGYFYVVVNYQWLSVAVISLCMGEIFLVTHISIITSIFK